MKEISVKIEGGEVILIKPKAGTRNKAMEQAENKEGFSKIKLMTNLLPKCIKTHPRGLNVQLAEKLDDLEVEDYDALIDGLQQLMTQGDVTKK